MATHARKAVAGQSSGDQQGRWYAAHLVMYFDPKSPEQAWGGRAEEDREYVVLENILLFFSNSAAEARARAEEAGRIDEGYNDETLRWGGHPVRMVFGGVRKVVECTWDEDESVLTEGDEVTYSELIVRGEENLGKLIRGDKVTVLLDCPEDPDPERPRPQTFRREVRV
jgi:hypothetical protein